jgi:hypothetical protein
MKRRELLFGGAAAMGASAAQAGTQNPAQAAPPVYDPQSVEATLAKIDKRMAALSELDLKPPHPTTAAEAELLDARVRVARAGIRSLYMLGVFTELPEHERAHPGVQARMKRMEPEMDHAVDGMATFLESLTPEDHRRLQKALKDDPHLGMRVGEQLEQVAKEDGFGFSRRADLRVAIDDYMRRMKTQNPSLVLDPLVRKTRKIQANPGTAKEREDQFASRMGEKAFWEFQQRAQRDVAAWDVIYLKRPRPDLVALAAYPEEPPAPPENTRLRAPKTVMKVGGIILGVGAGTELLGGLAYLLAQSSAMGSGAYGTFNAIALVLGVTVGPALIIGGLITLIVGGIMYAVRSNQPAETEQPDQPQPTEPPGQPEQVQPFDANPPPPPPPPPVDNPNGPPSPPPPPPPSRGPST